MQISDLLDALKFDAGDTSSDYRTFSRTWLNIARMDIASDTLWNCGLRPQRTLTTTGVATGLYTLSDVEFIAGDELYDETNENTIVHESYADLREVDVARTVTGTMPEWWADAGMDDNGDRQIYLWPIPPTGYTIKYPAYLRVTELTPSDDALTVDPYYGKVMFWSNVFYAGLRYYHDQNNNEADAAIQFAHARFQQKIREKRKHNRLSFTARLASKVIKTQRIHGMGRFNPAHFDNRG